MQYIRNLARAFLSVMNRAEMELFIAECNFLFSKDPSGLLLTEDDEADAPDEKASDEEQLIALRDDDGNYYDALVDTIVGKGGKWLE